MRPRRPDQARAGTGPKGPSPAEVAAGACPVPGALDPLSDAVLHDPQRLAVLRDYQILGSEPEPAFDEFVRIAATVAATPMALISLVDETQRWVKAQVGLAVGATPVETSFCGQLVASGDPLVVPDASVDPRFAASPAVVDGPGIRFYAGMPLVSPTGHVIGALAVLDTQPRQIDPEVMEVLGQLARRVVDALELRIRTRDLELERQLLTSTGEVLSMITSGAGLHEVLTTVALAVEQQDPDVLCSILLVDGPVLRDVAGPSLPRWYREAIDGLAYGPDVGSCGTAAYTGERVVSTDIAVDPRWDGPREVALPAGLRACWSSPILDIDGTVLGTFAQYFRTPRAPEPRHWQLIQRWTALAGLAVTRTRAQDQIRRMAMTDPLTGLPNRSGLLAAFAVATAEQASTGTTALLLMDLDRFKVLNDSLGHAVGDEYLAAVAKRLESASGPRVIVSRFGGDEFVVLATGLASTAAAQNLGERLVDLVRQPVTVHGRAIVLSASVGIAMAGCGDGGADALLRNADAALYKAKDQGRDRVVVFDSTMHRQALVRLELEADLRDALARGQLRLAYQPKVDLARGLVDGVEALARWTDPKRGEVSPADFVPVAEDSGLIVPLGRWVLSTALREHAARRAADPSWEPVTMWVNVSVSELTADLVVGVAAALESSGVPPARLGLEVTESSLMADLPTSRAVLVRLRELGVQLAIDDFGTGYSSLSQLKELPVDVLKIDKSFIDGLGSRVDDGVIEAVIALARAHGLRVVAEGVETELQHRRLCAMGCHEAQGYLFGRPGPLDAVRVQATARPGFPA
ncbi:MAG TPA: EAL domain-containing protein [Kineosporiaceae bacterium]|nr:EAL domain-containing protein [Kineosporiaceae bacterium]